jgi:hypothetical protein
MIRRHRDPGVSRKRARLHASVSHFRLRTRRGEPTRNGIRVNAGIIESVVKPAGPAMVEVADVFYNLPRAGSSPSPTRQRPRKCRGS